jgi:hypothetical protein
MLLAAALGLCTYFSCQLFVSPPKPPAQDNERQLAMAATAALSALGAAMPAHASWQSGSALVAGEKSWDHVLVWSAILVPLVGLVFPFVTMGVWTLYAYSDEFFYTGIPNHPKLVEKRKAWKRLPMFANYDDPLKGFVDMEDWEAGLVEAWEKIKPKGSILDAKKKLADMKQQNAPHAVYNKVWNIDAGNGPFTSRKDYDKGIYPKDGSNAQGLARSA